jgi:hypothetical protein
MGMGGGSLKRESGGGASINQIHQEHSTAVASEWMCLEGQLERSDPPPEK